jgi:hypothetical protein
MTPIDKAVDLIDKMRATCLITDDYVYKSTAKQCALVAVDEIIESWNKDLYENCGASEYWKEVRKEIEKL